MNQPTANTSHTNNLSAPSEGPSLVAPSTQVSALPQPSLLGTLPKPRKRKPKSPAPKSAAKVAPENRCRHFTATGRRCRLAILDPASGLCFRHVSRQFLASGDEDLSPAFLGLLSGFQSASRIHGFVTQVTVLLVQNRISTRRAAILAYLAQILLRTLPAIERQEKPAEDPTSPYIIMDIPSAVRDRAVVAMGHTPIPEGQRTQDHDASTGNQLGTQPRPLQGR